jgi:hypothetical protein
MRRGSCHLASLIMLQALNLCISDRSLSARAFSLSLSLSQGGLKYTVLESGKGPKPKIGDLVAIRFSVRNMQLLSMCMVTHGVLVKVCM